MGFSCSGRRKLHYGRALRDARLKGIPQNLARTTGTAATTGTDTELLAQLSQGAAAFGHGAADVAVGDGIADADVHGVSFAPIW
jgi:hypothetical protein